MKIDDLAIDILMQLENDSTSNYHIIFNVLSKLLIMLISFIKIQKNVNILPNNKNIIHKIIKIKKKLQTKNIK
jgi:hypothetical protein